MTIETKTEHIYLFYGNWVRGYGPSMDPHRCGHKDEPCVTTVFEREVSPWVVRDTIKKGMPNE